MIQFLTLAGSLDAHASGVYKWITRYRTKGGDTWYLSESTSPKHSSNRVALQKEELVVNVRKALEGRAYSQTGALSIMYEIEHLGLKPPSIPTINRILKRNNLINLSSVKQRKGIEYPNHFTLVQQMDLVGPRYLTGVPGSIFRTLLTLRTIMLVFTRLRINALLQ